MDRNEGLERKIKDPVQKGVEYRRAGDALSQSQIEWETTFDAIPELVMILDAQHRILRMNAAMADRLGLTPDEAVGLTCYEHVHGEKAPPSFCPHSELLKSGQRCFAEVYEKRLDGHFTVSASPLRDINGHLIGSVHVATDITRRKEAEEALQASEEKFRTLLDFIPGVSIQGYEPDGIVFYWNRASEDVYGYTAEEAIGRNLSDLIIPPDIQPHFRDSLESGSKAVSSGELIPAGELMLLHKNGSLVPVYSIHAVVCLEGMPNFMFCIDVDLTQHKKIEKELEAARSELERKVAERTSELRSATDRMAHEIEERKKAEHVLKENQLELEQQKEQLEQMNTALKVLLDHRDEEKKRLGEDFLSNVRKLIIPYVEKLEKGVPGGQMKTLVDILKSNLENLILPFASVLSMKHLNLTPTEIQIADLLRHGHSSKEISTLLNVSTEAVSFHRKNIRRKLGLTSRKTNLSSYLQGLSN